jgi:putative flippase GtrA
VKTHLISIFKFTQVSAIATSIDYGIGYFLVTFLHQNATTSTIIGSIIGGIVAYFCCKYWVFPSENSGHSTLQITKFTLINFGNLALNVIGVWFFTKSIEVNYLTMRALVGLIVFIIYSYGANKLLVFNKSN